MLNMCTHRGNRVVRGDDGNAHSFMCTYHGWTFGNDGCLNHIPGESEAYYNAIDKKAAGLIEARVDTLASSSPVGTSKRRRWKITSAMLAGTSTPPSTAATVA